jgi:hypothetical protein
VLFFFVQQTLTEFLQLYGEWATLEASDLLGWNFLDYLRLISMGFYIYYTRKRDLMDDDIIDASGS